MELAKVIPLKNVYPVLFKINDRAPSTTSKACSMSVLISGYICIAAILVALFPAYGQAHADQERANLLGVASPVVRDFQTMKMVVDPDILNRCLKASESYNDYSFNYSMTVNKNGKDIIESGTLYFKKPSLLRVEEKTGPHAGAVAVVGKDGKIKGHLGGLLKIFSSTVSSDNSMLRSINGWSMLESDFSSIWRAMQRYAKEGCMTKVSDVPASEPSQNEKVFVLEMIKPNSQMYKRALLEAKTMLPVEWWDYENGKVFAHSTWTHFQGNRGLSDLTFTLKGDK